MSDYILGLTLYIKKKKNVTRITFLFLSFSLSFFFFLDQSHAGSSGIYKKQYAWRSTTSRCYHGHCDWCDKIDRCKCRFIPMVRMSDVYEKSSTHYYFTFGFVYWTNGKAFRFFVAFCFLYYLNFFSIN